MPISRAVARPPGDHAVDADHGEHCRRNAPIALEVPQACALDGNSSDVVFRLTTDGGGSATSARTSARRNGARACALVDVRIRKVLAGALITCLGSGRS